MRACWIAVRAARSANGGSGQWGEHGAGEASKVCEFRIQLYGAERRRQ
jgi:hypothetical protein